MSNKLTIMIGMGVTITLAGYLFLSAEQDPYQAEAASLAISPPAGFIVPDLNATERQGEMIFNENCAVCHGKWATGTNQGPPLVHKIYEPSHHGDIAFHMAAERGVRAHHWRFGNMPAIEGVTKAQINKVIAYVRTLQRSNGIH